jgi:hypothetical protein
MSADENYIALRNAREDSRTLYATRRRHLAELAEHERLVAERAHRRALSTLSGDGRPSADFEGCTE